VHYNSLYLAILIEIGQLIILLKSNNCQTIFCLLRLVRLFSNTNSHKSTLKNIKSVRLYNLVIRDKEYIGVCLVSTMCLIFFVGGIFATIPPVAHSFKNINYKEDNK
jgi:hypothetical protein